MKGPPRTPPERLSSSLGSLGRPITVPPKTSGLRTCSLAGRNPLPGAKSPTVPPARRGPMHQPENARTSVEGGASYGVINSPP